MNSTLTAERLRAVLQYNQDTGVFTRLQATANAVKVGEIVGNDGGRGYLRARIDGRSYRLHRLAWLYMTGSWPANQIDHIDGQRSNNAWANLRDVDGAVNQQNRRSMNRTNKSGLLGVRQSGSRWTAQIEINGRTKYLGTFSTRESAHAAYLQAKRAFHPGFTL